MVYPVAARCFLGRQTTRGKTHVNQIYLLVSLVLPMHTLINHNPKLQLPLGCGALAEFLSGCEQCSSFITCMHAVTLTPLQNQLRALLPWVSCFVTGEQKLTSVLASVYVYVPLTRWN